jgi:hypothetical protein
MRPSPTARPGAAAFPAELGAHVQATPAVRALHVDVQAQWNLGCIT